MICQQQRTRFKQQHQLKVQQGRLSQNNKDGYNFGGKTKYGSLSHHQSAYKGYVDSSPWYFNNSNKWTKTNDEPSQKVYREYSQKVNDYTKNISQSIFSPGYIGKSSASKHQSSSGKYNRILSGQRRSTWDAKNSQSEYQKYDPQRPNAFSLKTEKRGAVRKPQSAAKSYRSAKSFSKMINKEKR